LTPRKKGFSLVLAVAVLSLSTVPAVGEPPVIEVIFEQDLGSMTVDWPAGRLDDFQQRSNEDFLALMTARFGFWNLERAVPGSEEPTEARWKIRGRLSKGGPKQAQLELEIWQPPAESEPGQTPEPTFQRSCELWGPLGNEFDRKIAQEWDKIADDLKDGFGQLLGCIDGPTGRCDSIRRNAGRDETCDSAADQIMESLKTIPVAEASWWDRESYPLSVIMIPISPKVLGSTVVLRLQCPESAPCTDLLAKSLGPINNLKETVTEPRVVRFGTNPYCIRDGVAKMGTRTVKVDETLSPLTPVYYFESVGSELRPACTAGGFQ
jgi:hypothetical protein